MNKKAKIITYSLVGCALATAIVAPITYFSINSNKNEWRTDKTIEIWSKWDDSSQTKHYFVENFVDKFNEQNKDSGYTVEFKTVSYSNGSNLGNDILLRMKSGAEVPNIFIGKPEDSINIINSQGNKSTWIFDINEILENNNIDIPLIEDASQNKSIMPYLPFQDSGEVLFLNKTLLTQFMAEYEKEQTKYKFSSEIHDIIDFKDPNKKLDVKLILDFSKVTKETLDDVEKFLIDNNEITIEAFSSYHGLSILGNLFWEMYIRSETPKSSDMPKEFFINALYRSDVSTYKYIFNDVKHNYDNYIFNENNAKNLITSKKAQDSLENYFDLLMENEKNTKYRVDSIDNWAYFIHNELAMFTGDIYVTKYQDTDTDKNMQWDEMCVLPAPEYNRTRDVNGNKLSKDELYGVSWLNTKTLNPIKINKSENNELVGEDIITKKFIEFVSQEMVNSNDFFYENGYIPANITGNANHYEEFNTSVNEKIKFYDDLDQSNEQYNEKNHMVLKSIKQSMIAILNADADDKDNIDIFMHPQFTTTKVVSEALNESIIKMQDENLTSKEAVQNIINRLNMA